MEAARRKTVIKWLKRVERSKLSIRQFFEENDVPFSKSQYSIYKRRFSECGAEGLCDRRAGGGNRKLNREAEIFLSGCLKREEGVSLEWLRETLIEEYGCELSVSAISRAVKRIAPDYQFGGSGGRKSEGESEPEINPVGGFELIIAVAYHLGWPRKTAEVISGAVKRRKRTKSYQENRDYVDWRGRTKGGKFTKRFKSEERGKEGTLCVGDGQAGAEELGINEHYAGSPGDTCREELGGIVSAGDNDEGQCSQRGCGLGAVTEAFLWI